MRNKKCAWLLLAAFAGIVVTSILSSSASADLYIYEPFDYTPTNGTNNGAYIGDGNQAGGLGLGTWGQNDNNGNDGVGPFPSTLAPVNEADIRDGGLTFTDTFGNELPVAGNAWERAVRTGQEATYSPIDPAATAGLTADNTSIWMTFLFQDRGFSGPDFGIGLHSETMVGNDNQDLGTWTDVGGTPTRTLIPGYGVGFSIVSTGGQARNIGTAVYNNSASFTRQTEATPTFNGPGSSDIHYLAMKVNWNEAGTPDEIYVFDLTDNDILVEPDEADALASDTFDFTLEQQQSLDVFNISDTQVSNIDEVRIATTYLEAVGETLAPSQAGDFNGDSQVEQIDLNLLLTSWGATTVPPEWTAAFDGLVDQSELNDLLTNWGAGVPGADALSAAETTAPEPATLGLLLLGGLAAIRRRK